jgi:hypothetical protein
MVINGVFNGDLTVICGYLKSELSGGNGNFMVLRLTEI